MSRLMEHFAVLPVATVMNRCSVILWTVLCLLLCTGAVNTNTSINIMPRNLTVREGEEASFTCEIPCAYAASWYVGDIYNSIPLPYADIVPGIAYTRNLEPEQGCAFSDPGNYVDRIRIVATRDLDGVAVQCSASMISCEAGDPSCGTIIYSRFRTLRVESDPEIAPSPSLSSSSSHTEASPSSSSSQVEQSTACPTPSPVVVTKTVVSTHTETVRTTVVVEVTGPTVHTGSSSDAGSSLLKGLGLTSAVVVSSIVVIVSMVLRL